MENLLANQVQAKTSRDWLSSFPALSVEDYAQSMARLPKRKLLYDSLSMIFIRKLLFTI